MSYSSKVDGKIVVVPPFKVNPVPYVFVEATFMYTTDVEPIALESNSEWEGP